MPFNFRLERGYKKNGGHREKAGREVARARRRRKVKFPISKRKCSDVLLLKPFLSVLGARSAGEIKMASERRGRNAEGC